MQSSVSERKRQVGTGRGPGVSFQSPAPHPTYPMPAATQQCRLPGAQWTRSTQGFYWGWFKRTCAWGRFQTPKGRGACLAGASLCNDI